MKEKPNIPTQISVEFIFSVEVVCTYGKCEHEFKTHCYSHTFDTVCISFLCYSA